MNTDKIKMPLAVIMTINGARGLLWNLVANYHFSGDDIDIIMRCIKDLENLNLILQKQDNVSNNVAKPDLQHSQDLIDNNIRKENMRLQAENNRLREVLKDIFIIAKRNKSALLATPENNTLSRIENECALALIGESEEK